MAAVSYTDTKVDEGYISHPHERERNTRNTRLRNLPSDRGLAVQAHKKACLKTGHADPRSAVGCAGRGRSRLLVIVFPSTLTLGILQKLVHVEHITARLAGHANRNLSLERTSPGFASCDGTLQCALYHILGT